MSERADDEARRAEYEAKRAEFQAQAEAREEALDRKIQQLIQLQARIAAADKVRWEKTTKEMKLLRRVFLSALRDEVRDRARTNQLIERISRIAASPVQECNDRDLPPSNSAA